MEHDLFKVGMSSRTRDGDLSDLGKELDQLQALGVDFVELSAFDFDLIAGGGSGGRRRRRCPTPAATATWVIPCMVRSP